jgi:hypothetical protein
MEFVMRSSPTPSAAQSLHSLVPPARFAALLVSARSATGKSLQDMAEELGHPFSFQILQQIEAAVIPLNDDDIRFLARGYNVHLGTVTEGRATLSVDLSERTLSVGGGNHASLKDADDREVFLRYLALVYQLRNIEPGQMLVARDKDLEVLSSVFDASPEEINTYLVHLMQNDAAEIKQLHALMKRRVAIPGLGVLLHRSSKGGLIFNLAA